MTVGEKILKCRKELKMSQEELGKKLLVSRQTISLWEKDQTVPTIDNLIKLKEIFGVSVDEMLGVDNNEKPEAPTVDNACSPDSTSIKPAIQKRRIGATEIIFLILGSPIWISLLVAALAVAFSLYAVLWAVVISLWAVFASLIATAIGGITFGVSLIFSNSKIVAAAVIGAALVLSGVGILIFYGCELATKGTVLLTQKITAKIKSHLIKGEDAKNE